MAAPTAATSAPGDLAPAIMGWDTLPLGTRLRSAFPGAQIRMATDAKAAAAAEVRWGALAGFDPALYLNLGTGLSAAIVVSGHVLVGANGAAGEIGYNLRALSDVGMTLDTRVPLEDMVSGQALARRAAEVHSAHDGQSGHDGHNSQDGHGSRLSAADGGGLLAARDPLLTGWITERLAERAPAARPQVTDVPPIAGAALMGLDRAGAGPAAERRLRAAYQPA